VTLSEMMVAGALLVLSVTTAGSVVLGPVRAVARAVEPSQGVEGMDTAGLAFVTAVREARSSLSAPAVLEASSRRLVLGIPGSGMRGSAEAIAMTLLTDRLLLEVLSEDASDTRALVTDVAVESSAFIYRDRDGIVLDADALDLDGLDVQARARIGAVDLVLVVVDPLGRTPEIVVTHRARLRLHDPLA